VLCIELGSFYRDVPGPLSPRTSREQGENSKMNLDKRERENSVRPRHLWF
jgi:hypothetical protein